MAVVTGWVPLPPAPVLVDRAEPYLVRLECAEAFRAYLAGVAATVREISITDAGTVSDVVRALGEALPLPDWSGHGWDSIDDAFEEIRQATDFPLVLVVHGLPEILRERPHLGLETVLGLSRLSAAFSAAQDQLLVVYPGSGWR